MNNKRLGDSFEREMVNWFSSHGYWAHFLSPDRRGAQPFDIIAVRDDVVIVGDCKTTSKASFNISRLEDNQVMAFQKWITCGNSIPYIFVKYGDQVWFIPFDLLTMERVMNLKSDKYKSFKSGWWLK